LQVSTYQSQFL